jgi:hypothetical protein
LGKFAKGPTYAPDKQTKCQVTKSKRKPLVVEWPSAERGDLEARSRSGLVVVRYDGCEMELLTLCQVEEVGYEYIAYTPKKDKVSIRSSDDLYASIPMGAAKFESKLEQSGELGVEMTLVGKFRIKKQLSVKHDQLSGSCEGATHVISGLTVGAFEFFAAGKAGAGAEAKVGNAGAGLNMKASRETLTRDGEQSACSIASTIDEVPPEGCAALLRVEVLPIKGLPKPTAAPGPAAPAAKPPPDAGAEEAGGLSPVAWVGYGVGAAGLIAAGVTGGMALSTTGTLEESCPNKVCSEAQRADHDKALTLSHVATTGFAVGGAGLALGLIGTFALSVDVNAKVETGSSTVTVEPRLGATSVGLGGSF